MTDSLSTKTKSTAGRIFSGLVLCVLLLSAMILSLKYGLMHLSFAEFLSVLTGTGEPLLRRILLEIRLPRVLLGAFVGAGFSVSGAILQGVMRNPLASPGIIGVSAGGGLAGILVMLVFPAWPAGVVPASFCGSLTAAILVYLLSWKQGASPIRLVLSGVAVASMLGAISSVILLYHAEKAGNLLDFSLGSLSAANWQDFRRSIVYLVIGLIAAQMFAKKLNVLALGDDTAASLGLSVEWTRFLLIGIAALLAAASVSAVGLLGFVGLIAPHIVRLVIGSDHRFLLPCSALFGAFLVVLCDLLGRLAAAPGEFPVGVVLALLGPPFFLWLLRRQSNEA